MINAETGMVFGVASASVAKDDAIRRLMGDNNPGGGENHSAPLAPMLGRASKPEPAAPSVQAPAPVQAAQPAQGAAADAIPWMDVVSFRIELKKKWDEGYYPVKP
jgi:hypothetical protein